MSVAKLVPSARDPRDVEMIKRLEQQIQELEGNPLLTKETKSKPIWDIGDEEEEYHFVNKHLCFQEEPIVLVEEDLCHLCDIDNEEKELMPVYDTNIEDVIEEEEGFVGIEESSGRSFKHDSLLDAANLARDIYLGSSNNIIKQKRQEDHVETLSQQLNNVPIDSDSAASSHKHRKRQKFKGRGRVPMAAKNEMSMAFNFVNEGTSHSKQHIEDYDGEQNVTRDLKNGCEIPFNWSRIHDLGKSFLDIGRSLSCGLSDSRLKSGGQRDSSQMLVMSDHSTSSPKVQALLNAIAKNKVGLLYVFYGPHGARNTSCVRIFARALTSQSLDHSKPCGYCNSCVAHDMGKNQSVREVGPMNNLEYKDNSHHFKMVQLLFAPSTEIQRPHRRSGVASPTNVMSSAPNTPLMNLFSSRLMLHLRVTMKTTKETIASRTFTILLNENEFTRMGNRLMRMFRIKGELVSLFFVESTIKKELDQNIHALATALEDGKSCVGKDITCVQIALSNMCSLSNLFVASRQKAKIPDIMERMEMVVGWLQSNRPKIDDFLKRYAMSQELKEPKDKKKCKGNNNKGNNNKGNNNKGKKINDNAYKIESLGHYNMSATFDVFDLSPYFGESDDEENSRTSFYQVGEDDAGTLDRNVNLVEYLKF
nr:protein STICHEL-like 3 [Tanacetum cinerariifolium]